MVLSGLSFAIMASAVKLLDEYPVTEKLFFRNFLGIIFSYIMAKKKGESVSGNNKFSLILRAILGVFGVGFYFYSIQYLNLADAVIINKLAPFIVLILSWAIIKEDVKMGQFASLILAVIGVGLVVKPGLNSNVSASIIGILGAIFAGFAYTVVSFLKKTDSPETIVFYLTLITSVAMIPFAIKGAWVFPNGVDLIIILVLGVTSTLGQIFMTYAYRMADASYISIYSYSDTIFSGMIGWLYFGENIDIYTALGGIFVISAGYLNYKTKNRERKIKT